MSTTNPVVAVSATKSLNHPDPVHSSFRRWFFTFFLLSGFCSILYELIWMRLAMADFGVTTPLLSIVLSVFMAGIGLGSWASGRWIRGRRDQNSISPLKLYAAIEALIGISALVVPFELSAGRDLLDRVGPGLGLSSGGYYVASGILISIALIPWCCLMGATFPVAMSAFEKRGGDRDRRSFSFLYIANLAGAAFGTMLPMLAIEVAGFRRTLLIGAVANFSIAVMAVYASRRLQFSRGQAAPASLRLSDTGGDRGPLFLLLLTGLTSMGMEVVWTRLFTPYLGTVVYSFAMVLLIYLLGTYGGSWCYRRRSRNPQQQISLSWALLGLAGVLPLFTADPHVPLFFLLRPLLGIAPFAALLGFVTPCLVDRWSGGDPARAGRAYAVNILGCIAGPLLAGFFLLPASGERVTLLLLSLPWCLAAFWSGAKAPSLRVRRVGAVITLLAASAITWWTHSYEQLFAQRRVLRDSTATVVATTIGNRKELLINGIGTTTLSPVTKIMAHLPLAELDHPPKDVLVIGFGMGTAHRAVLTWGINSTAVELVPSVPHLFTYYHPDGDKVLADVHSHVVIDDGRRYLERSAGMYDLILIDPPPPVEAAGSSLLYSRELYQTAKRHLRPNGILQQWLPYGDPTVQSAMAKALKAEYPYIRAFRSFKTTGFHFLGSMQPLPKKSADTLAAALPPRAAEDLVEFGPYSTATQELTAILAMEFPVDDLIAKDPGAPMLTDDRPVNEFFLLRLTPEEMDNMENAKVNPQIKISGEVRQATNQPEEPGTKN